MRYRLRTLMIVLALGPPMLAVAWPAYQQHLLYQQRLARQRLLIRQAIFAPMPCGIIEIVVDGKALKYDPPGTVIARIKASPDEN